MRGEEGEGRGREGVGKGGGGLEHGGGEIRGGWDRVGEEDCGKKREEGWMMWGGEMRERGGWGRGDDDTKNASDNESSNGF